MYLWPQDITCAYLSHIALRKFTSPSLHLFCKTGIIITLLERYAHWDNIYTRENWPMIGCTTAKVSRYSLPLLLVLSLPGRSVFTALRGAHWAWRQSRRGQDGIFQRLALLLTKRLFEILSESYTLKKFITLFSLCKSLTTKIFS